MTLERLDVHVYKEMLLWAIGKITIRTSSKPVRNVYGLGFIILFTLYFIFFLSQVNITVTIPLLRLGNICESEFR